LLVVLDDHGSGLCEEPCPQPLPLLLPDERLRVSNEEERFVVKSSTTLEDSEVGAMLVLIPVFAQTAGVPIGCAPMGDGNPRDGPPTTLEEPAKDQT